MANILCFSRNRCTSVEQVDDHTLRSSCRLQDRLTDASVEIMVRLPDLEIINVTGEFRRSYQEECLRPAQSLQRVVGVRIGPSMLKIIEGLIGEASEYKPLAFMVEECCQGVILAFTKDEILKFPRDNKNAVKFFADLVKENIRLYNRCAACAPGSPIVDGIDPPG